MAPTFPVHQQILQRQQHATIVLLSLGLLPLPPQDSFHTKNAITYIKTHEAVAKLRDNLRLEHNVVLDFCAALFQGVLRPHQMGYLLVQVRRGLLGPGALCAAWLCEDSWVALA